MTQEKPCKCFICERDMAYEGAASSAAVYDGGTVEITFGFGSRKFDYVGGFRKPVYAGTVEMEFNGKIVDVPYTDGDSVPNDEILQNGNKAERLACCSKSIGYICDECFEKKSHLLGGWEYNKETNKYDLLVDLG